MAKIAFTGQIHLGGFDVAHTGLDLVITGAGGASLTLASAFTVGVDQATVTSSVVFKSMKRITSGTWRVRTNATRAFRSWFDSDKAGQSVVVIDPGSPALSAGTPTEADLVFGWSGCGRSRLALTATSAMRTCSVTVRPRQRPTPRPAI